MSRSTGKPWTKPETELAAQKRAQGETCSDIARMLGRTVFSVANKIHELERLPIVSAHWSSAVTPYPGVARCRCGLALPCNDCLARNAPEHVHRFMVRPGQ